jgi:hypothetical protein
MRALCSVSIAAMLLSVAAHADVVPVKHLEGRIHGFLVLRNIEDHVLASGTLNQSSSGNRVTTQLRFQFKDGSLYEETSVYSQSRVFRLLTYHLVQKGSAFKRPTDMTVSTSSGKVMIRYTDEDGKEKSIDEKMKLPADLSNGLVTTLLSDVDPMTPKTTLSMLVSTPKPRLVKLEISPAGESPYSYAGTAAKATRYVVKVEIGGISGVIAPLIGKQPLDTYIWIAGGSAPGFLKSEGALFDGGPIWKIELASPVWPKAGPSTK